MNFEVSKIMDYLNQTGKKLTKEEIRKKLGVSYSEVEAFEKGIKELEETGKLYLDDKGFYHVFSGLCGAVKLSATGEGYINIYENDHKKKYMIPNDQLFGAQHGDFVIIIDNHRKKEGLNTAFVHRVLKRNQEKRIFR